MADNQNELGGKVGLDASGFKSGVTELNRQIRVIESGFKATAAGMEAWDKEATGVQARIDSLGKTMELQRQKVAALTAQYEKVAAAEGESSKAAQDLLIWRNKEQAALGRNEVELRKAAAALNKLEAEENQAGAESKQLGDALDNLGADLKGAAAEAEKSSASMGKFHGALGAIGTGLKNVGGAVGKAAVAGIAAVGTAAVGAAVGAFSMAKSAGEMADNLLTLSAKTGLTIEQLQEMQYAARFVDVDLETMTGSMMKLTKTMNSARDGKGNAASFEALGIAVTDSNGNLRDAKTVWSEALTALGGVANETERDALAMELFGKSAAELNPLIEAGTDELAKLSEEAHAVGAVLGDDAVKQAGKFDDMLQTMQAQTQALAASLGVAVMPAISSFLGQISSIVPQVTAAISGGDYAGAGAAISTGLSSMLQQAVAMLPGLTEMAVTILTGLTTAIVTAIPQILPGLTEGAITLLQALIQLLADNGPMLIEAGITALMTIIDGLVEALPQLVEAAVTLILSLVQGLIGALPKLVEAAIKMVSALVQGLIDALPQLIKAAPELVKTIVKTLVDNLPLLIDAAIQIITALVTALIENLPLLLSATVEIIAAILGGLIESLPKLATFGLDLFKQIGESVGKIDWGNLGKNIISGIGNGVKNAAKGLADSVARAAANALQAAKDFLGIQSPSKVFDAEVGQQIGAGMARGITRSAKQVNSAITGVNEQITGSSISAASSAKLGGPAAASSTSVVVNVPLTLDGVRLASATSRTQHRANGARARALGVAT